MQVAAFSLIDLSYRIIQTGRTSPTSQISPTSQKSQKIIMKTEKELKWTRLSSKYLIQRPWLTARRDRYLLPDGREHNEYYVLEYPDWVNVIAETKDGKIILEHQYRPALGVISTEICAGVVEKGEEPLHAAQRELMEETGFGGGEWTKLMTLSPNPSTMTNLCHCFLARGVEKTGSQHLDATEDLEYMLVPRDEVRQMLLDGKFIQALMIAPLWKFFSTIK